jgi:hypothetical protein
VRINKGQRNLDGLDLATLQTQLGYVQQQITNRLSGNGTATVGTEEVDGGGGLYLRAMEIQDLYDLQSDLANAIQKKQCGSTFTQASFGCDSGGAWGSGADPNPFWRGG